MHQVIDAVPFREVLPYGKLLGRRTIDVDEEGAASQTSVTHVELPEHSSDEEEEIEEITIPEEPEDGIESVSTGWRSTDQRDHCRDMIQKMEIVIA